MEAARRISLLIPPGKLEDFEGPDFTLCDAGTTIGIEVTELLRAPEYGPFPPVQTESVHREVVR